MNIRVLRTAGVYILRSDREEDQYEHGSAWNKWRLYFTFTRGRNDQYKWEYKDRNSANTLHSPIK